MIARRTREAQVAESETATDQPGLDFSELPLAYLTVLVLEIVKKLVSGDRGGIEVRQRPGHGRILRLHGDALDDKAPVPMAIRDGQSLKAGNDIIVVKTSRRLRGRAIEKNAYRRTRVLLPLVPTAVGKQRIEREIDASVLESLDVEGCQVGEDQRPPDGLLAQDACHGLGIKGNRQADKPVNGLRGLVLDSVGIRPVKSAELPVPF